MIENPNTIRWPANYAPENAPIHVRNELEMDVAPEAVWAWLVRAQLWPTWYKNSSNVRFLSGTPPDLDAAARFQWTTFGVRLESRVLEFVPGERIAWDAHGIGIHAYHAWVIQEILRGTYVRTEETQRGWLARLAASLRPRRMHEYHQIWLEHLREVARTGLPPQA
jgi:uncharacterized protein YndB with AHSA1/START domain